MNFSPDRLLSSEQQAVLSSVRVLANSTISEGNSTIVRDEHRCECTHVFHGDWHLVVGAQQARFDPDNVGQGGSLMAMTVAGVEHNAHDKVISFTRYTTVAAEVPWVIRKATGLSTLNFQTDYVIDYGRQRMRSSTHNRTLEGMLLADETCVVKPDPAAPGERVILRQEMTLEVQGIPMAGKIGQFLGEAYCGGVLESRMLDEQRIAAAVALDGGAALRARVENAAVQLAPGAGADGGAAVQDSLPAAGWAEVEEPAPAHVRLQVCKYGGWALVRLAGSVSWQRRWCALVDDGLAGDGRVGMSLLQYEATAGVEPEVLVRLVPGRFVIGDGSTDGDTDVEASVTAASAGAASILRLLAEPVTAAALHPELAPEPEPEPELQPRLAAEQRLAVEGITRPELELEPLEPEPDVEDVAKAEEAAATLEFLTRNGWSVHPYLHPFMWLLCVT
jgi:hypothetical protein